MLAARLSEDPDRNVLLLEAGPDYSSIEQTPADLTNSLVSSGPHDWGLIAWATPGGKFLIRAAGSPAAARQSTAKSRCTAHRRTSRNGRRGAIASGASSKSCHRRLEDDRDARGDVHGAGGPIWIERPRSEASQPLNCAFFEVARAAGYAEVWDHNDPDSTGVGPSPRNRRDGFRISTAIGYLAPARHRLNLTIRPMSAHCVDH